MNFSARQIRDDMALIEDLMIEGKEMYAIYSKDDFHPKNLVKVTKEGGRWHVGGDVLGPGDQKKWMIIAKNQASRGQWGWFSISGRTLKFSDMIDDEALEKLNLSESRLTEKFLKAEDPTILIGKFLEKAGNSMSAIQNAYNKKARDRNMIVDPVLKELSKLAGHIATAQSGLQKQVDGTASPEDTNRSINKPGE